MLRICERRGWSLDTFFTLSETEQLDLLAHDHYRQTILESAMNGMIKRHDGERTVADLGAYFRLFMETL